MENRKIFVIIFLLNMEILSGIFIGGELYTGLDFSGFPLFHLDSSLHHYLPPPYVDNPTGF